MNENKNGLPDSASSGLINSPYASWGVLVLVSFVMTANYYFYDCLSPLKSFIERDLRFSSSDFGLYISFYALPNTWLLTPILGGIILDKIGIRRSGLLFVLLMALGALLTAYGVSSYYRQGGFGYGLLGAFFPRYSPELKMLLLGRLLFGLGGDTSIVVISKILVKWFRGKDLALAFAVNIGLARLGSAAVFNVSPWLARFPPGWVTSVWFACASLGAALFAFLIYMLIDARYDRHHCGEVKEECNADFRIKDVLMLLKDPSFLLIAALCMTFYSSVLPFQSYSADFFLNKYRLSPEASGFLASLIAWGTIIFTPLFGWIVDKKGKCTTMMIFGSLLLVGAYLLFSLTSLKPYFPLVSLGIAFALVPAALWPAVSKIVEERKIGTAYGVMFSFQNLGLWITPLLLGIILDASNAGVTPEMRRIGAATSDYTIALLMLALIGVAGLVFSILLKREDGRSSRGLDLPLDSR